MVMSIGDIFAIADSASSSIRVFRTGVSAAEEALSAARSQRLPDISVSASVSYLGNGVLWDRNFGNPQKIDIPHFCNNLAIEAQQVIYAGGAVSSGIETARLERASRLPQIAVVAADHLDVPITIEVPVLNNNFNYWYVGLGIKYDISSLYKDNGSLRRARLNVRKARESYALAQEELSVAVQAGYVDFLTSFTDLRTQEKAVELADENYGVISNRYSNDLALLTDMVVGGVMGSALYARGMAWLMPDNIARYGDVLDPVTVTREGVNAGQYMDMLVPSVMEVSIKQIYGWVLYACIQLLLLFLLYDAPIRRQFKAMPRWQTLRRNIARSWRL